MTQLNLIINSLPRDLSEFVFFIIIGFTAGSLGLVWYIKNNSWVYRFIIIFLFLETYLPLFPLVLIVFFKY